VLEPIPRLSVVALQAASIAAPDRSTTRAAIDTLVRDPLIGKP